MQSQHCTPADQVASARRSAIEALGEIGAALNGRSVVAHLESAAEHLARAARTLDAIAAN